MIRARICSLRGPECKQRAPDNGCPLPCGYGTQLHCLKVLGFVVSQLHERSESQREVVFPALGWHGCESGTAQGRRILYHGYSRSGPTTTQILP